MIPKGENSFGGIDPANDFATLKVSVQFARKEHEYRRELVLEKKKEKIEMDSS